MASPPLPGPRPRRSILPGVPEQENADLLAARLDYWNSRLPESAENGERANNELLGLWSFVGNLSALGMELAHNPILVDTGQWNPVYDRPRSYADIENEIASILVNLPKFRAKAKLLSGSEVVEHSLQVAVPSGPRDFRSSRRTEAVRDETRRNNSGPLNDVLDRIDRRGLRLAAADEAHTQRRTRVESAVMPTERRNL